ncbi:MAG: hypothetical protein ACI8PG_001456 [Planctomycetota bacterium]|jgi:hypothetical protein
MGQLFSLGISVPKPYFWGGSGALNNPYYVMEKIEWNKYTRP